VFLYSFVEISETGFISLPKSQFKKNKADRYSFIKYIVYYEIMIYNYGVNTALKGTYL